MIKVISIMMFGFLLFSCMNVIALPKNIVEKHSFSLEIESNSLILNKNLINITWKKHVIDDSFDYPFGVQAFDLDKDGDCDVLGAAEEGDSIAWWRNEKGCPIIWTKFIIDDNFDGATSVYAVDIDDDGDNDVVGSSWHDNEIALWFNEGGNPPTWAKYSIKSGFHFAHEVNCHDLDSDGDIDILGASSDDNQIAWWCNEGGNPISWTEQIITNDFLGAKSVRVADIDNDGLKDIIGAAILDDKIIWWRNLGGEPISWEKYLIDGNFYGAHRAEPYDMDYDGDIDIVGAAYFGQEIFWWRNDGGTPIRWTKQVITTNFKGACIGLPVDIDIDGDVDIIGTAQQHHDIALFRNDGGNPYVWTKVIIDPYFRGAWPGYVNDIDNDGDIDIVAGASFEDKLAWWESDLSPKPHIPEKPLGPSSGKPNIEYIYSSRTEDPQNDDLFYLYDWGDGNDSGWLGPSYSGETCEATYSWENQGNYEIKVKARDVYEFESNWSDPLIVSMSKNKKIHQYPLIIKKLLENLYLLKSLSKISINDKNKISYREQKNDFFISDNIGKIYGNIKYINGSNVFNSTVLLREGSPWGFSHMPNDIAKTDSNGYYKFENLSHGRYHINPAKIGFKIGEKNVFLNEKNPERKVDFTAVKSRIFDGQSLIILILLLLFIIS